LLIEVKPLTAPGPILEAAEAKIAASGWTNETDDRLDGEPSLIVGCGVNLDPSHDDACCDSDSLGWLQDFSWGLSERDACYLARCPHCGKVFYWNHYIQWDCQHCGQWTDKPYNYSPDFYPDAKRLLALAQNRVQWEKR
jgi:hypothetical protein